MTLNPLKTVLLLEWVWGAILEESCLTRQREGKKDDGLITALRKENYFVIELKSNRMYKYGMYVSDGHRQNFNNTLSVGNNFPL